MPVRFNNRSVPLPIPLCVDRTKYQFPHTMQLTAEVVRYASIDRLNRSVTAFADTLVFQLDCCQNLAHLCLFWRSSLLASTGLMLQYQETRQKYTNLFALSFTLQWIPLQRRLNSSVFFQNVNLILFLNKLNGIRLIQHMQSV